MADVSRKTEASFRRAAKRIKVTAERLGKIAGPAGLRGIGEEIMTDVKASRAGHGVPRDEGVLASTGRVDGPVETMSGSKVELSFGGPAAPYALKQHEELSYHHTVGEARYLVRGVERWKPGGSAAFEALKKNAQEAVKRAGAGVGQTGAGRQRDPSTGRFI